MDIGAWLNEQKLSSAAYDIDTLINQFLSEMELGLNGQERSLAMIPAYISPAKEVPANRSVAVIDAGGTNLRIGLASFNEEGDIQLSHFTKQAMPGRDQEATADEFYQVLCDALEPIQGQFDTIGFCFSYPATVTPELDGELLYWSKEIKLPELVGRTIGSGLVQALEKRGYPGKKIALLNDTVAALLAGIAKGQTFQASSYVGFILGTGTNTAYVEKNQNIGKLKVSLAYDSQIINVEAGGFNGFACGPYDLKLDAASNNPGLYMFEKTISGVYIGPLTLEVCKALVAENIFSETGAKTLNEMDSLSTIHINHLTANISEDTGILTSDCFTDSDRDIMRQVFTSIVERAALLTAVNIGVAVIKSGAGQDEAHPVCINIDGSTYYKTYQMAEKVQAYLQQILSQRGLFARSIHVEDAPVVGAAIAGLTALTD